MTDEQIIKALECCIRDDHDKISYALCGKCAYLKYTDCKRRLRQDVFDLINRLKAEIEKLNVELVGMRGACESYKMHYDNAQAEIEKLRNIVKTDLLNAKSDFKLSLSDISEIRSEAIKEFAERLKPIVFNYYDSEIDNLVKEMVGDSDA